MCEAERHCGKLNRIQMKRVFFVRESAKKQKKERRGVACQNHFNVHECLPMST